MPNLQSLPGFRDFYPDDMAVRAHLTEVWRDTARRYGFQEYDGPPLEPLELYTHKSGSEIVQQLYNFVDKGGREVALRPEMTPTFARMVAARVGGMPKPVKWFSIPQLFRYERQQRGRLREHFQFNMDIVGEPGEGADAELVAAAIDTVRAFGLGADDVILRVSDRRLLAALLLRAGVAGERLARAYSVVDKVERESRESLETRLSAETGLDARAAGGVLELFAAGELEAVRQAHGDNHDIAGALERVDTFFELMGEMGLRDFVRFDLSVVRGLAYYTGIVFELFDARSELRAVAGGGRYDGLLSTVGGPDLPAAGFAMGDVVLRELLVERGLLPGVEPALDYYLVAVTPDDRSEVLRLAHRLRDRGWSVEYGLRHQGAGKQFKNADSAGARLAVVIGPEERAAGVALVRKMKSGEEEKVPLAELAARHFGRAQSDDPTSSHDDGERKDPHPAR